MALDNFILKKGQVVVTQDVSSASGMNATSNSITYGYVEKVSDLSDMYAVGDYIIFNAADSVNFTFYETALSATILYCLTTEDKLFLIEPYIAP